MKKYIRASILTPLAIGIAILIYLVEALAGNPPISSQGDLTETFYPILLSLIAMPFIAKLIRDGIREANTEDDAQPTAFALPLKSIKSIKSIGVALAIGLFVLGFASAGFAIAAPIFVFVLQCRFDGQMRGVFKKAMGAIGIAAVVYLLYVYGFDIRLPIVGGA